MTSSSAPSSSSTAAVATAGATTVSVAPKKVAAVSPQPIKPAAVPLKTQVVLPSTTTKHPAVTTATRRPSVVGSSSRASSSKSKKKKSGGVTMATAPNGGGAGENTGRWTAEEHRLFLQGLEQHGKGWKKIASLIKSRTVVQIRTHAQKYFQKLAKARQNGEEGEVTMEGRGGGHHATMGGAAGAAGSAHHHDAAAAGAAAAAGGAGAGAASKHQRRRSQLVGTKRKVIQSVVTSAHRQGKKLAAAQAAAAAAASNGGSAVPAPAPVLPAVAPALAHFVMPQSSTSLAATASSQGTVSGPALEDSLFRFLTPVSVGSETADVARQAGANPITLPSTTNQPTPNVATSGGEISPTGVQDLNNLYPAWTDAKDPPSWYAKGADVDALLDVADTLDWLADTGDLNETYQPADGNAAQKASAAAAAAATNNNSNSTNTLPHVDSNVDNVVPPLPSLFEGDGASKTAAAGDSAAAAADSSSLLDDPEAGHKLVASALASHPSDPDMQHLVEVFDSPMEEHDFVSTILETKSTDNLQNL